MGVYPEDQKEGSVMAILVQFKDNTYDFVVNNKLDELIKAKDIVAFKRSSGWVEIDKDPVRNGSSSNSFTGVERRFQY